MSKSYNLNVFYANKDLALDAIKALKFAEDLVVERMQNNLSNGNYYIDTMLEIAREINWLIKRMESSMQEIDESYDKKDDEKEEQ